MVKSINANSPSESEERRKEYNPFIKLKTNVTFNEDAFDNHVNTKPKELEVFKETKGSDVGLSIYEKPVTPDDVHKNHADQVKNQINLALSTDQTFLDAQAEYKASVNLFKKNMAAGTHSAESLIDTMTRAVSKAGGAIHKQHQSETNKLEQNFQKDDFLDELKKTLGLVGNKEDPQAMTTLKDNMLADLKASQKKQLEDFDTATCDSLKILHEAAAKEKRRIFFIANLHKNNDEMHQVINQKIQSDDTQVRMDLNAERSAISGLALNDFETIASLYGNQDVEIKRSPDGSYSINFPKGFWHARYYLDPRENVQADLNTLAATMFAQGHKKIDISVDFADPELASKRARQSYAAFINAGYDPKNFTINLNEVKYTASPEPKKKDSEQSFQKLFEGHQKEYAKLNTISTDKIAKLKEIGSIAKTSDEIKKEMSGQRDRIRTEAKAAKAQPTANQVSPGNVNQF